MLSYFVISAPLTLVIILFLFKTKLNRKLAISVQLVSLTGVATAAPTPPIEPELIPYLDTNGHYGFVDSQNNLLIPSQFDEARPFSNKLAAVRKDKLWGYIDTTGAWKVEPRFDEIDPDSDGYAVARIYKKRIGLGEPRLRRSGGDGQGFAPIDLNFSITFRDASIEYSCIDQEGKVSVVAWIGPGKGCNDALNPQPKTPTTATPPQPPTPAVSFVRDGNEWRWAIADASGQAITPYMLDTPPRLGARSTRPLEYSTNTLLNDAGLARVRCKKYDTYGIVNPQGNFLIPCEFRDLALMAQGNQPTGFMGTTYKEQATIVFNMDGTIRRSIPARLGLPGENPLRARYISFALKNTESGEYFNAVYDLIHNKVLEGKDFGLARQDLKQFYVLDAGNQANSPLQIRTAHEKYCFYNSELQLKGCQYDSPIRRLGWDYNNVAPINQGLYLAYKEDKACILDDQGTVIIPFKYERISPFDEHGLAKVQRDKQTFYINLHGKEFRTGSLPPKNVPDKADTQ